MVAAFSGFLLGSISALQQFGFGLAVAILIDATLIRMLLVPAFMQLAGSWNWHLPACVARLLRVEPSDRRASRRVERTARRRMPAAAAEVVIHWPCRLRFAPGRAAGCSGAAIVGSGGRSPAAEVVTRRP